MKKEKIIKRLNRVCPDCKSKNYYLIEISEEKDGIVFSNKYHKCMDCYYKETIKDKRKNKIDREE
ncbi:MAG: hypothetical protein KatS3mg002_1046 [Candidatus Woesearchaeota archaeon]|jgi:hypothetical protein|nr:MAG: hypothetical protein KatS3mg002_1046 [Candidatus Woesearchaeota archaeon]